MEQQTITGGMTIEIFCDHFISIKKYGNNELANDDIE